MSAKYITPEIGFWSRVDKTPGLGTNGECWHWIGKPQPNGYCRFAIAGKKHFVHRLSYEFTKGEIPFYSVIRHTCDNPICVNPDHLLLGSQKDNMRDMVERGRNKVWNMNLTHCQRGHEFTIENTRLVKGGKNRVCRECLRLWQRDKQAKIKQKSITEGTYRKHKKVVGACKSGHIFTPENTYITVRGSRICRICSLERYRDKRIKAGVEASELRPIKQKGKPNSAEQSLKISKARKAAWDNARNV